MLPTTLLVAAGAAVGSMLRYWIALWRMPISRSLPWSTILINITGSFLITLLAKAKLRPGQEARAAVSILSCSCDAGCHQHIADNDAEYVSPQDMLAELCANNQQLTKEMRRVHRLCDEHGDIATASLLENWIDETERRTWFLFESSQSRSNSDQ